MDFSGVLTELTTVLTDNTPVIVGALALGVGTSFVMRLIRRAAK